MVSGSPKELKLCALHHHHITWPSIVPGHRNNPNIFVKDHNSSFADGSEILKLLGSSYVHLAFKINSFLIQ